VLSNVTILKAGADDIAKIIYEKRKGFLYISSLVIFKKDSEVLRRVLKEFLQKFSGYKVWIRAREEVFIKSLLRGLGFELKGYTYIMRTELPSQLRYEGRLKFKRVSLKEIDLFIRLHDTIFIENPYPSPLNPILRPIRLEEAVILVRDNYSYYVYLGEELVGLLALSLQGSKGVISVVGVLPEYRGRGIGREIMFFALSKLRDFGVKVVELGVDAQNIPAVKLYEKLGFKVVARYAVYSKSM